MPKTTAKQIKKMLKSPQGQLLADAVVHYDPQAFVDTVALRFDNRFAGYEPPVYWQNNPGNNNTAPSGARNPDGTPNHWPDFNLYNNNNTAFFQQQPTHTSFINNNIQFTHQQGIIHFSMSPPHAFLLVELPVPNAQRKNCYKVHFVPYSIEFGRQLREAGAGEGVGQIFDNKKVPGKILSHLDTFFGNATQEELENLGVEPNYLKSYPIEISILRSFFRTLQREAAHPPQFKIRGKTTSTGKSHNCTSWCVEQLKKVFVNEDFVIPPIGVAPQAHVARHFVRNIF